MSGTNRTLLSLDLATRLGWAAGDVMEGEPMWGSHRLPSTGEDIGTFLKAYHLWLIAKLKEVEPALVLMEAPMPGGGKTNMSTIAKLWNLCGHTEFVCAMKGIRCLQASVNEWRPAFVGPGKGRISKPKTVAERLNYPVIQACRQRGWMLEDDNEADALGLWVYGVRFVAPGHETRFDPLSRGALNQGAAA